MPTNHLVFCLHTDLAKVHTSHSPPAEQLSHLMIESTLAKMAIILHHTFPVPSYLPYNLEP